MFFVNDGTKNSIDVGYSTTEELGPYLRRRMDRHGCREIWITVGTRAAVMPYAQLYKKNGKWRAGLAGDCIRLGLDQNELPEDPEPMMLALDRGDTVVMEQGVEVLDTGRVTELHQQAKQVAARIWRGAKDL